MWPLEKLKLHTWLTSVAWLNISMGASDSVPSCQVLEEHKHLARVYLACATSRHVILCKTTKRINEGQGRSPERMGSIFLVSWFGEGSTPIPHRALASSCFWKSMWAGVWGLSPGLMAGGKPVTASHLMGGQAEKGAQ